MFVLKLPLEVNAANRQQLDKKFALMTRCHNILVKRANRLLSRLRKDPTYKKLLKSYHAAADKESRKTISKQLNDYRNSIGLSKSGLESYISVWQKQHKKNLSSHICQKEVDFIMQGVNKIVFNNGKELHYHRFATRHTIATKSNYNGIKLNVTEKTVSLMELTLPIKRIKGVCSQISWNMLKPDLSNVSYVYISREAFNNGYHYYALVTVKDDSPVTHISGNNTAGIDPGVSTVAYVSDNQAVLTELAPKCKQYTREIDKLQNLMDVSRRKSNPDNYNSDGTVKSGRLKWVYSKAYKRKLWRLRNLYRCKSAYIKQSHNKLANRLIKDSRYIYTERMSFAGLAKRSKNTERQPKAVTIRRKDGTAVTVYKYKRKKRFGRSVGNRAPSAFLTVLKQKLQSTGGDLICVNTNTYKASQLDHTSGSYEKKDLSVRMFTLSDGTVVQRDLYSAFLISNADPALEHPDADKCNSGFSKFVTNMTKCIDDMKHNNISYKTCFGF